MNSGDWAATSPSPENVQASRTRSTSSCITSPSPPEIDGQVPNAGIDGGVEHKDPWRPEPAAKMPPAQGRWRTGPSGAFMGKPCSASQTPTRSKPPLILIQTEPAQAVMPPRASEPTRRSTVRGPPRRRVSSERFESRVQFRIVATRHAPPNSPTERCDLRGLRTHPDSRQMYLDRTNHSLSCIPTGSIR